MSREEDIKNAALNASSLFNYLKSTFSSLGWENSTKLFDVPGTSISSPYFIHNNDTNCLLTTPAHDGVKSHVATTALPLREVLQEIKENNNWQKAIIPIAQSRSYFFGLFKRQHWTYIEMFKDNDNTIKAHHYDSKGFISRLYPLHPLKKTLKEVFKEQKIEFSSSYYGKQDIRDNINCGRYVISHIMNHMFEHDNSMDYKSRFDNINEFIHKQRTASNKVLEKPIQSSGSQKNKQIRPAPTPNTQSSSQQLSI